MKSEEGIEPCKRPSPPPTGLQCRPIQVSEDTKTPEKENNDLEPGSLELGGIGPPPAPCEGAVLPLDHGPFDADHAVCRRGSGAASRPQTLFTNNLACSIYDCIFDVFEASTMILSDASLPDAVDPCKGRTSANLLSPTFVLHQLDVVFASSSHRSPPFTCCRSVVRSVVCPLWGLRSCSRIPLSLRRRAPSPSSKGSRYSRFRPSVRSCIPYIFPSGLRPSVSGAPEGLRI